MVDMSLPIQPWVNEEAKPSGGFGMSFEFLFDASPLELPGQRLFFDLRIWLLRRKDATSVLASSIWNPKAVRASSTSSKSSDA